MPQEMPRRFAGKLDALFTTEQFTSSQIIKMFVPLVFDQLFIFAMGMLSAAMVSSSGEAAISAVSLVGTLGFIVASIFNAVATGGTILVAQARGSGDDNRVRIAAGQTVLLTSLVALVCTSVFICFADPLVNLLYARTEPLLKEYAMQYLRLISLSYVPYALFNAIFSIFRGLGDSKSSLLLTIIINTIHLIASFILIKLLNLGVTGAGLSYILARVVGAAVAVLWLFKIQNTIAIHRRHVFSFVRSMQAKMVRLGVPLALEQVLFQVGMLLTQIYIAMLPTHTIAANAIANSAFGLYNAVAFCLTTMVTTVCGQCIGARRPELAQGYAQSFIRAGRWLLLFAGAIISAAMPLILKLYSPTSEALPQIYLALLIGVIPLPLIWCDANVPGAAMRAAGDAMFVTVISLASMWTIRVAIGYVLTIPLGLGIAGVWLGLVLEWAFRAMLLRPRLRSGKWLEKAKEEPA